MAKKNRQNRTRQSNEDDSPDILRGVLANAGLRVCTVESDGNCLFRAFASQFSRDEELHHEFRLNCCQYMIEEEPEFFGAFLDDKKLEDYVSEMQKDGVWGTQMEVVALCRRYRAHCVIFRPDGLHYRIECASESDVPILMISHHDEEHFNEVCFAGKSSSSRLESFNELELLLTELEPASLSKREVRALRRSAAVVQQESTYRHKLVEL